MSSDLWSFAIRCYGRPGVEQTCLRLQDGGSDICLVLCALWLEQRLVACDEQRLGQLLSIAEPWQLQVVQPLRELRRSWRERGAQDSDLARLREQLKVMELEAERALLERLESAAQKWQATDDAVAWLERLSIPRDAQGLLRAAARSV